MTDMTETITWHRTDEAMPDEGSFALVIRRKNTDPLEGWCGTALMSKGMWWGDGWSDRVEKDDLWARLPTGPRTDKGSV